ncbi:unnamed protein product [Cuscuta campestris]|uniref:Serine-threonine/tyrosine-protein kinase catalytic domain-containing protein n=1 Tax=Cuscuta campestris TaxID=132261 RepID=A0A484KI58_9ASTE|nr:unnamed protein product [Cuscuta campestris]
MLTRRRALDTRRPTGELSLMEFARPRLTRINRFFEILDPRMEGQYSKKTAALVAHLACQCVDQNPKARPTVSEVVYQFLSITVGLAFGFWSTHRQAKCATSAAVFLEY